MGLVPARCFITLRDSQRICLAYLRRRGHSRYTQATVYGSVKTVDMRHNPRVYECTKPNMWVLAAFFARRRLSFANLHLLSEHWPWKASQFFPSSSHHGRQIGHRMLHARLFLGNPLRRTQKPSAETNLLRQGNHRLTRSRGHKTAHNRRNQTKTTPTVSVAERISKPVSYHIGSTVNRRRSTVSLLVHSGKLLALASSPRND